jgi:hypothetical protein
MKMLLFVTNVEHKLLHCNYMEEKV